MGKYREESYWRIRKTDSTWYYECANCGGRPLYNSSRYEVRSRFCPWCGAYMNPLQEEQINELELVI